MKFPSHKCGLYLTHNEHKDSYETVEESNVFGIWVSEQEKQKALTTNECWTLTWYPDTPVGSHSYAASTLESLLEYVNRTFP